MGVMVDVTTVTTCHHYCHHFTAWPSSYGGRGVTTVTTELPRARNDKTANTPTIFVCCCFLYARDINGDSGDSGDGAMHTGV